MLHPMNPFPELLTYSFFVPTIFRLVVGMYFLLKGYLLIGPYKNAYETAIAGMGFQKPKATRIVISVIEIIGAIMLILGWYTQIAAIVLGLWTLLLLKYKGTHKQFIHGSKGQYFFLLVILFSLLITGAGAMALDWPL